MPVVDLLHVLVVAVESYVLGLFRDGDVRAGAGVSVVLRLEDRHGRFRLELGRPQVVEQFRHIGRNGQDASEQDDLEK